MKPSKLFKEFEQLMNEASFEKVMKPVSLSAFIKDSAHYLQQAPIIIKGSGKKKFIILDAAKYNSMKETPVNVLRHIQSIGEDKASRR